MRWLGLVVLGACASAPAPASAPSASASAPESASGSASGSAPGSAPAPASASGSATPPPIPTGGSVLVGDINAPKGFNPKPTVEAHKAELVDCYNQARAYNPDLHGKVTLRIQINEAGAVLSVDAEPGPASDARLVACVNDVLKASAHFPKPGGMATVNAPLVFRR